MQLTRKSEIAIDILCACASGGNRMIATKDAAEVAVATKDHAAQVVRVLVNAGYLCSVRDAPVA